MTHNLKAHFYFILTTVILLSACKSSSYSKSNPVSSYSPISKELYDTIYYRDSLFFTAFNNRNLDDIKTQLSKELEFYHDLGGVTNYNENISAFEKTFRDERKVRRVLLKSTLEVYPIKDYGAVETGTHRFYITEKGQQEILSSEAKFVHVWKKTDGEWIISRIISYGHQEYLK